MKESEIIVKQKLKDIVIQLTDLSEGYLNCEEFENDPEASVKSTIDGLIDYVKGSLFDINNLYND